MPSRAPDAPRLPARRALMRVGASLLMLGGGLGGPARRAWAAAAPVSSFTPAELGRLQGSGTVERRFELHQRGVRLLAALSYAGVNRTPSTVFATLLDAEQLPRALPATRAARYPSPRDTTRLWLQHGTFLINGSYTLIWQPDPSTHTIRFWLDREQPTDADEVFGFFRAQADRPGHSIVSVGLVVDPGDGVVAAMFRHKVHDYLGRPARYIKNYMHRHVPELAARREP